MLAVATAQQYRRDNYIIQDPFWNVLQKLIHVGDTTHNNTKRSVQRQKKLQSIQESTPFEKSAKAIKGKLTARLITV
jgi:hypothetical protein